MFGMTRGNAAKLPEVTQLVDCHVLIGHQMIDRIMQHRAVTGRENKAVAIRPLRITWIDLDEFAEQHCGDIRHSHRHPGVSRFRSLHRVNG